jgi:hypothetical protein
MQAYTHLISSNGQLIVDSPLEPTSITISPANDSDWPTLIRDITALANSGGGQLRIASNIDEHELRRRLLHETQGEFADIAIHPLPQAEDATLLLTVGPALFPISLLSRGFYFRHGERSEPATSADMRAFIERVLRRVRRRWLQRFRRIMSRPVTSLLEQRQRRSARKAQGTENLQPVRIVTDPDAPALHPQDVDRLYPWRQKDLLRELNTRLGRRLLNSYDIQAVRRQHKLDERPEFVFNLPGAGRRYSPATAEWIMEEFSRDAEFFQSARTADRELMKLRRQKPR